MKDTNIEMLMPSSIGDQPPDTDRVIAEALAHLKLEQKWDELQNESPAACEATRQLVSYLTDCIPSRWTEKPLCYCCIEKAFDMWSVARKDTGLPTPLYAYYLRGLMACLQEVQIWDIWWMDGERRNIWDPTWERLSDWWKNIEARPHCAPRATIYVWTRLSPVELRTIILLRHILVERQLLYPVVDQIGFIAGR